MSRIIRTSLPSKERQHKLRISVAKIPVNKKSKSLWFMEIVLPRCNRNSSGVSPLMDYVYWAMVYISILEYELFLPIINISEVGYREMKKIKTTF